MAKRVAILTLVGNTSGGKGPGHTAVVIDGTVHTFENYGDWVSRPSKEKSGWLAISTKAYLAKNTKRPVIVQEMKPGSVSANKVLAYVKKSTKNDDDYIGSGVCSSQVANGIDAGTTATFNPKGVDTPFKVFQLAERQGLADKTYLIWADPQDNSAQEKLDTDYKSVSNSGDGILKWH